MNQQPTTEHTDAPEQPMLPGMEENAEVRTGSDSDWVPQLEELAAENENLRAEIRMRDAVYEIKSRLAQAGAKSPGLLTDRAKESFQFSDEGGLANAEAVVEHLRKTYPRSNSRPGRSTPPQAEHRVQRSRNKLSHE